MAATTFPAAMVALPRRSLARTLARLRQGSEVRAAQQHAHPGVCDLDGGLPADVLCAVRHRAGTQQSRRSRQRDLHAGDHGMLRRDGGLALRLRREPGHGARTGLAAGEARFADAGERLLLGQAVCGGRLQHRDHPAAADGGNRLRRRASAVRRRPRSCSASWSPVRFRSARWGWRSATSPSRTRRRRWST